MIKINLLPFRAARKRENIRRQITIYVLIVFLTFSIIGYKFIQLSGQVSKLKEQEENIRTELGSYQKELNEIKSLEKKINEVRTKLNVIKTLETGKTGPVLLLADIAEAVPKEKLWLKSLTESSGSLTLTGTAMDYPTVALFSDNLKETEHVTSAEPKSITERNIPEYNLKVSDFTIEATTYAHE